MSEYILEMEHISKTFPGVKALDNVELKVQKGEVHALIGENGAGKSTLIKVLAGIHGADEGGKYLFEGEKADIQEPMDATLKGMSIIYQDLSLFPNLSVAENIYIGRDSKKKPWTKINWKSMKKLANKALAELDMDIDLNKKVELLSIAQQQMIEIARALAFDSKLIVMDEPTSSLSSGEVEKLYNVIDKLKERGISVIFISHKLKELFRVSDRFTVLRDGQYVGTYDVNEIDEQGLIKKMVGREVVYETNKEKAETGEKLFEISSFSKEGNFKDIDLTLHRGEILAITGLVGSGRTELAQSIFGITKNVQGEMWLKGEELKISSSEDAVKKGIAYVPEARQTQGLVLEQSVINNMTLPIIDTLRNKLKLIDRNVEKNLTDQYIKSLDVRPAIPELTADKLSGGNQQKVVIGKWLSAQPKLLIIDEPTNGIDIGAKTEIHKLLRRMVNEGIGVIMISSELPEVLSVSDRILVMSRGRIAGEMNTVDADQEEIMKLALDNEGIESGNDTKTPNGTHHQEV
ncbi:sugar ABC transporter ATP-binding protein [Salibacterium halotolerans]|uniref:Ribose transport system ATP-binding protein/rhamnose transport system ATP-binding protein n=1 Tax=Salibacterium halotolerans TaxID=1884432 RepID=A0A1I5TLV9_9BACI|nr:sugar ABC transporter ATP-binding protein [Salibacterium halotolerans]SFP84039.1 ribose transport system ATP-binding protein/rhamnose transport system ATP-binding protein [Salibacterium halotolerans]